ncbi:protein STICHEL-like 2 isoform X2 [Zingiber officinale]|uniref:protein STICHEL-like 2 isoform X2 n=1 Tax=Zingiber officinale TaxID=94328 RepID=UPI001C4BC726|nr:protein STICHEL-like 2 isoform X2 [Zingiber officinale]
MTEASRHSVDIPLSKTLVALKRVRSLRDPSTNSLSKFTAVIENLNLVANSSNAARSEKNNNKHKSIKTKNCCLGDENDDIISISGSNFSSTIPFPEKPYAVKIRGSKSPMVKLTQKKYRNHARKTLDRRRVQHSITHVEEEVNSYRERVFDLADRNTATVKKSLYKNLGKQPSLVSLAGSPCLSANEAHTTRSRQCTIGSATVGSQSKSNDVIDSHFSGCGISYCWSGTPKYTGRNFYSDDEEQEMPLLSAEQTDTVCMNITSYPQNPRSLSQKYRPKSFSELVGQNVVSESLLHAITKRKIAPLYLFHGPQGNGKSSTARIFAAALNCVSEDEDRPCGFCQECVFLFSGRSRNVKELDASKINHKERFKSLFKSACTSRYEVFIIDECQSLREEAWAAISKCLDEKLGHALCILISSDIDAWPRSYLSKCQRYYFPKIKEADIVYRLEKISIEEELQFDMDALGFIATKSNGSLRDAETLLDQLALLGKRITLSLVNELIGVVSDDELLSLLDLALSSDTANTVRRARDLMMTRIDPLQLVSQLANVIMDILAGRCGFSEIASDIGMQKLRGALKVLSDTEKQLRSSKNQATWLTVALLQLSTLESSPFAEVNSSRPSLEMPYLRDDAKLSTTNAWDGKNSVCYSLNQNKPVCSDRNCSGKKFESIWRQVTQRCQSNSFKIFLQQEGCLSAVYVHQGVTVAEIEFYNPEHVSRAAKSQELIACALRHVLGRNLEVRIKFVPKSIRKVAKTNKSTFSLLNCSGRKKELSLSTISDEGEIDTSEMIENSSKIYSSHHSRKFSPFASQSAGDQLANGVEMKEMISPTTDDNAHYAESEAAADGQGKVQKDGKVEADPSGKLGEMSEYVRVPKPEIQPNCFPRRLKFQRRFFSSNTAPTICLRIPQQNRSELSIPDNEASETYFCMYDPYTQNSSSASHFTCSSREENIASKDSKVRPKLFCWKMPKPQAFD